MTCTTGGRASNFADATCIQLADRGGAGRWVPAVKTNQQHECDDDKLSMYCDATITRTLLATVS
jgi:hypothetical protein